MADQDAFLNACGNGNHGKVERLLLRLEGDRRINVHAYTELGFRIACQEGHRGIVEHLLSLEGDRYVNVHVRDYGAFHLACRYNRTSIVELLLSLEGDRYVDVHAEDEYAFRLACRYGYSELVDLFLSLAGDRAIPRRRLVECKVKDVPKRTLIAMWACKEDRGGNAQHAALRGLDRPALAEVLRLLTRPW